MTFVLPEIEKESCQSFTACGRVVTKDKSLRRLFPKKPFIASVKCGRLRRFVRLAVHEGGFLHLEVATPAYFEGRWNPKPTHAWPQIQTALSRFAGQTIEVRGVGVFVLPFERLPESSPIRALSVASKTPKMSMKLTSGAFSVTGAPIEKITWSLVKNGKGIEFRLRSTRKATVNEMYLVDLFSLLNESLQVFVLDDEKKFSQP